MKYERAYREDAEKWEPIGEKNLRAVFRQNFEDVDLAIKQLESGERLQTSFAIYRKRVKPLRRSN